MILAKYRADWRFSLGDWPNQYRSMTSSMVRQVPKFNWIV